VSRTTSTIEIYEPPQSCATGACAPDATDPIAELESALSALAGQGIAVARYNLGLDPEAFASNPLVKGTLRQEGMSCLPLVVADGAILCKGRYPSAAELEARRGAPAPPA
jgi:hypothetical protein